MCLQGLEVLKKDLGPTFASLSLQETGSQIKKQLQTQRVASQAGPWTAREPTPKGSMYMVYTWPLKELPYDCFWGVGI